MKLIEERYSWKADDGLKGISFDDHAAIKELLLGRKVAKVADDHVQLDNGVVVKIVPNDGGCMCGAGDYMLSDLNEVDNIITAVECAVDQDGYSTIYSVFVVAEDKKLKLWSVEGDDGNGYYGTGYELLVRA